MSDSRREFLKKSGLVGASVLTGGGIASAQHQGHMHPQPTPPPKPEEAPAKKPAPPKKVAAMPEMQANVPVETPDVPKLPFTLDNGVKVFQLSCEVVKSTLLPGMKELYGWGYNGSLPGPTIEVTEGDRVRIILQNKLPEATSIHWHGIEVPTDMDGVPFISQPMIEPGASFTYEFTLHQHGTFFYHSHNAMQQMMGTIGLFIIHPQTPHRPHCDKDFGLILQEFALLPNNPVPNTLAMEFNWLTINGKAGPATTPMIVKQGERVRLRIVNIGMDHHPMHIHGHQFYVTGTEGGRVPETAWYPGNTVLVAVAQARDIEFQAVHAGNWMFHCHLPHHMMNNMVSMVGHDMGGADEAQKKQVPGYPQEMVMIMDKEVAKPQTYGLPAGWTASMMGMMTLVRVLPPDQYDEVQRRIREGITEMPQAMPNKNMGHKHD
jgi:manganese oxidase